MSELRPVFGQHLWRYREMDRLREGLRAYVADGTVRVSTTFNVDGLDGLLIVIHLSRLGSDEHNVVEPPTLDDDVMEEVERVRQWNGARLAGTKLEVRRTAAFPTAKERRDWIRMLLASVRRLEKARQRARARKWAEAAASLGLTAEERRVWGSYRGADVELRALGRDPSMRTSFVAPLGPGLPAGLTMRLGGIRRGNVHLDELDLPRLRVAAAVPERVTSLFRHSAIRDSVRALFAVHPDARVERGTLRLTLDGWKPKVDTLHAQLAFACGLVFALQQLTDWPEKRDVSAQRKAGRL